MTGWPGLSGVRSMRPQRPRDAGAATVFVVAFAIVLLVLAGLVVDGGLAINARQQVADDVEQAARAGAEQVDVPTLRGTGRVVIDSAAAGRAAENFLGSRRYTAAQVRISVDPVAGQVTATATRQLPTALLSLIFIRTFTVTATGTARAAVGITGELTP